MQSTITHDRSISINEAGVTTIRYEVDHDQDRSVRLTFEEYLPDAVDLTTIAVDRDRGKWAVYDDGTVQWSVSVRAGETATGEFGLVCTDPETIAALVEESTNRVLAGEPAAPPDTERDVDTIEPDGLASASASERVPESVYEAVRKQQAAAGSGSTGEAMKPNPESVPTDQTEPATTDDDPEPDESADGEEQSSGADQWNGDPLENALRVKDHQSRADENAYRFVLDFDEDDANDTAIEVLTGLLNGTTVFGANPTLPDLEAGVDPETLTVTVSSPLGEEAIVSALEDIERTTIEHFETLDVDLSGGNPLDTNADQQFRLLEETIKETNQDAIARDVEPVDNSEFDFGNEPITDEDPVEEADDATADGAVVDAEDGGGDGATTDSATGFVDDDARAAERTGSDGGDGTAAADRVTARLLDELEAGGVTERERVELRRRLGVDPRTSTELRLDHLHSRVDELVAYTDALEAFLDDEGTAQEILEHLSESVSTLETRTDDLEDQLETRTGDLEDQLETRTGDLEDQLETRTSGLEDQLEARTQSLEDRLDEETADAATERDSLDERIEELASEHASERERVSGIADAVSSNNTDIDHLATDVKSQFETIEETIDDVTRRLSTLDDRVTKIEDTLGDVEDVVEQNARVRERLEELTN